MVTINKSKGHDDVKNQPVLETVVSEEDMIFGSLGKVFFDVSRSGVVITGNNGVKLSTDEAIKLFAGLLEDIKVYSNDERIECHATGESCSYERVEIPSEFIDGQEGWEVAVITQCKYCGKPFEYEDKK